MKQQKQFVKQKIIEEKIDSFKSQGFNKIVLAGHSAGAWASITLKSKFPKKINGVIAFNPTFAGTKKNRNDNHWWEGIRKYGINLMELDNLENILVFSHNKDRWETPKTLSFLSSLKTVKFIDLSDLGCEGKVTVNGYHGIIKTKCFVEYDSQNKNIMNYLEGLF